MERFIGTHAADVRGRVLEVAAPDYTARYGTDVERVEVLTAKEGTPDATVVGDLEDAPHLPSEAFDCVIADRTLQFVYDVRAAFATIHRVLATGGVRWRRCRGSRRSRPRRGGGSGGTSRGAPRSAIAEETFGPGNVEVETTATC